MTDEIVLTSDERANNAALMPIMGMDLARGRYQALVDFTRDIMREGTDFGTIPGTGKPTLLKPGSEKLFTFFGLRTAPRVTLRTEDWEKGFFAYEVECDVFRGDTRITVGLGSCNSREGRYHWRWVPEADLPAGIDKTTLVSRSAGEIEFAFAVDKAETNGKYGKPKAYWDQWKADIAEGRATTTTRKTKAGKDTKAYERGGTIYRVANDDPWTLTNTILKMAVKRAVIDACLRAVNASEFFTQDIEDLDFGVEINKAVSGADLDTKARMREELYAAIATIGIDKVVIVEQEAAAVRGPQEAPGTPEASGDIQTAVPTTQGQARTAQPAERGTVPPAARVSDVVAGAALGVAASLPPVPPPEPEAVEGQVREVDGRSLYAAFVATLTTPMSLDDIDARVEDIDVSGAYLDTKVRMREELYAVIATQCAINLELALSVSDVQAVVAFIDRLPDDVAEPLRVSAQKNLAALADGGGTNFGAEINQAETIADLNKIAARARSAGAWQAVYPTYAARLSVLGKKT